MTYPLVISESFTFQLHSELHFLDFKHFLASYILSSLLILYLPVQILPHTFSTTTCEYLRIAVENHFNVTIKMNKCHCWFMVFSDSWIYIMKNSKLLFLLQVVILTLLFFSIFFSLSSMLQMTSIVTLQRSYIVSNGSWETNLYL